jgi:hypothetical protein
MRQNCRFFKLPRELRDSIYQHYVTVEGGYHQNSITGKLVNANGQPIDLALAYACKLTAVEMRGFPFKMNAIVFSTLYCEDLREIAGWFDALSETLVNVKSVVLCWTRACLNTNMIAKIAEAHPDFIPIIQHLQGTGNPEEALEQSISGDFMRDF